MKAQISTRIKKVSEGIRQHHYVHGIREFTSAKNIASRLLWMASLVVSIILYIYLQYSVANPFYNNESALQVKTRHVTEYPAILLCPPKIPMSVILASGYTEDLAKLLSQVVMPGRAIFSEKTPTMDASIKDKYGHTGVQSMMKTLAEKHIKLMNIEVEANRFIYMTLPHTVRPVLVPSGYCIAIYVDATNMASVEAQYTRVKVSLSNRTLLREMGGIHLEVVPKQTNYIPGSLVGTGQMGCVAELNILTRFSRQKRNVRNNPCSHIDSMTPAECLYKCIGRHNGCNVYNPLIGQTFKEVCLVGDLSNSTIDDLGNRFDNCKLHCRQSCQEILYDGETAVHPCPAGQANESFAFHVTLRGVESMLNFQEVKALTTESYMAYTFGNMAVFFGFNGFGILCLFWRTLLPRSIRKLRRTKILMRLLPWALSIALLSLFAKGLLFDFLNEKTSEHVLISNKDRDPIRLVIFERWLSDEKLQKVIKTPPGFWEREEIEARGEKYLPFMCDYLYGFVTANPYPRSAEYKTGPEYTERIQNLSRILSNNNNLRTDGLIDFMKSVAHDGAEYVVDVTQNGIGVQHHVKTTRTTLGIGYEVIIYENVTSRFEKDAGPLTFHLRKQSPIQKCTAKKWNRLIFPKGDQENPSLLPDIFAIRVDYDYALYLSSQKVTSKNRQRQSCAEDSTQADDCLSRCSNELVSCGCRPLYMGDYEAEWYNVSETCNTLNSQQKTCVLMASINTKTIKQCEEHCVKPCEQRFYHLSQHPLRFSKDELQKLEVHVSPDDVSLHVQEFFVYDVITFCCNVGGMIAIVMGVSYVSFVKAAEYLSTKFLRR